MFMNFTEWQAQQARNSAHFHAPRDMREELVSDKPIDPELMRAESWDEIVNLLDRRS